MVKKQTNPSKKTPTEKQLRARADFTRAVKLAKQIREKEPKLSWQAAMRKAYSQKDQSLELTVPKKTAE